MEELLSTRAVADLIGVSERRVRALIDSGQLPATRLLGRWGITFSDAENFRGRSAGRPLSEASAWAVLTRLAGASPGGKLPTRLARRLLEVSDRQDPVQTLRGWTARRAETAQLWGSAQNVEALMRDERVIVGGGAALNRSDSEALRVYVDRAVLDEATSAYGLSPERSSGSTPVTVSVVGDLAAVPRSPVDSCLVAAPVAAIDVLDAGYSKVAAQLLESALGVVSATPRDYGTAPVRAQTPRRPHAIPHWLDELRGPVNGVVTLPVTLNWGPKREYDLAEPGDERALYRQVIQEAVHREDLDRYLRAERLVELWPSLHLPDAVAAPWEDRFPELVSARVRHRALG